MNARLLVFLSPHLTCLLSNLCAGQEATFRTRQGTIAWFKIRKRVCQGLYCHPAYLADMKNASCEIPRWMNHKLESRLPGEISTTSIGRWYHSNSRKWRGTKELVDGGESGQKKKTGLKLNIQKTKIMASGPITSWWIDGKKVETVTDFYFLGLQKSSSLRMVIAVMKLKDTCSLEEKLWQT